MVSYGLARALTTQQVDNAVPDTLGKVVAIAMADTEMTELSSPDQGTDQYFLWASTAEGQRHSDLQCATGSARGRHPPVRVATAFLLFHTPAEKEDLFPVPLIFKTFGC